MSGKCNSMKMSLVASSKVVEDSCVLTTVDGEEKVVSNEIVKSNGIYTFVTGEEYIVVNGFVASPFAVNHAIPHNFYNIHRLLYNIMPTFLKTTFFESVANVADEIAQLYAEVATNEL